MAKDFIVAIELGSSKMTGIAGRKNPDGSITVLAVASEDSTSYIRKGVVYNIDKTAQGLSNIISKLKNTLQSGLRRNRWTKHTQCQECHHQGPSA